MIISYIHRTHKSLKTLQQNEKNQVDILYSADFCIFAAKISAEKCADIAKLAAEKCIG